MELRVYDGETGRLGVEASLYDVCKWWIETYPDDIFINEPKEIVEIRKLMIKILNMQQSKRNQHDHKNNLPEMQT